MGELMNRRLRDLQDSPDENLARAARLVQAESPFVPPPDWSFRWYARLAATRGLLPALDQLGAVLQPGDTVKLEITGLGTLENPVKDA